VPEATFYLFRAIATWTKTERITLTNISFPSDPSSMRGMWSPSTPLLPEMPLLRSLYLGQATFLPPISVAAMIVFEDQPLLEEVRLVDTYKESIWGRRIRRRDIEKSAVNLDLGPDSEAALQRIRRIVRCEAQNERVIGGDRAEGLVLLE
jgi:hypothetical protein